MDNRFVREARRYIGTRWKHRGRDHNGLDCVGLIIAVGVGCGLSDTSPAVRYPRLPDKSFLDLFDKSLDPVSIEDSRVGDIAILTWNQYPCHCGILAMDEFTPTLIHAHARHKAVIEERMEHLATQNAQHVLTYRYREN